MSHEDFTIARPEDGAVMPLSPEFGQGDPGIEANAPWQMPTEGPPPATGDTGGRTDFDTVMSTATNVTKALQAGDLNAASEYASLVDPLSIRSAKMDLFDRMREAPPEQRSALMQQGRALNNLQRASFAFELINAGDDREGIFLLQQLMEPRAETQTAAGEQVVTDQGALPGEIDPSASTGQTDPDGSEMPAGEATSENYPYGTSVIPSDGSTAEVPGGTTEVAPGTEGGADPYSFDGGDGVLIAPEGTVSPEGTASPEGTVSGEGAVIGDGTTSPEQQTGTQATSPLRVVMDLSRQLTSAGLTPEMKQQFEAAIQQADSGQSPVLTQLKTEFDAQSQALTAAITPDISAKLQELNTQLGQQMSTMTPEQQSQVTALFAMLDAATSAEDKTQVRQSLLELAPGMTPILDQRDQITAPFEQQLFAVNALGQELNAEQNQAAVTRMIYAQTLVAAGDRAGAAAMIDQAIARNADPTLQPYLDQAKQTLAGTASTEPESSTVPDGINSTDGTVLTPPEGSPPDGTVVTPPEVAPGAGADSTGQDGSVVVPQSDDGLGLGAPSEADSGNPFQIGR